MPSRLRPSNWLALSFTVFFIACAGAGQSPTGGDLTVVRDGGGAQDLTGGGTQDLKGVIADLAMGAQDLKGVALDLKATDLKSADLTSPPDSTPVGKAPGDNCTADNECQSQLCKPVVWGGSKVCVVQCSKQGDCSQYFGLFCEPITAGSQTGYCIPRSPTHCSACAQDSDCGSLSERCMIGPGDPSPACHIDCSIDGANACPVDYDCRSLMDGTNMRMLCVPKPVAGVPVACLDALGGYCDRVSLPQTCVRTAVAGTCTGQRVCISNTKRYDRCDAKAPQYKMTCTELDPAGCMLKFAPGIATTKTNCGTCGNACGNNQDCCNMACTTLGTNTNCAACGNACGTGNACCNGMCTSITTVNNCGSCGKVCPGLNLTTNDVTCTGGACGMTCKGENYDVDNNAANGCEKLDNNPVNSSGIASHTQSTASARPSQGCDSGTYGTFSGTMISDSRVHQSPTVTNFNMVDTHATPMSRTTGAAADWWVVYASGGLTCVNDYYVEFRTSGGGTTPCYRLTFKTSVVTRQTAVIAGNNGFDNTVQSGSSSQYGDGTNIYFIVEKVCTTPPQEAVTYTVRFHL